MFLTTNIYFPRTREALLYPTKLFRLQNVVTLIAILIKLSFQFKFYQIKKKTSIYDNLICLKRWQINYIAWKDFILEVFCRKASDLYNPLQKMKFSIKYFFSKCDQIHKKLRIWSQLLKKYLKENFIFCAVTYETN